ncbi:MAG: QueT transporter family protein [Clostridia bacterium]|nr:QueT transporter family protein [Clostridia bacterium]
MNKKSKTAFYLTQAAIIAALYAALVYLQNVLVPNSATMAVQVRVAEALTMLSVITPAAIPGLTLGCLLANFTSVQIMPLDVIFGTLATFLASVCMYRLRNLRYRRLPLLSALMPVIFNGVIIGLELTFFIPNDGGSLLIVFLTQGGLVALGEVISVMLLGIPFIRMVEKRKIFQRFN